MSYNTGTRGLVGTRNMGRCISMDNQFVKSIYIKLYLIFLSVALEIGSQNTQGQRTGCISFPGHIHPLIDGMFILEYAPFCQLP